MEKQLKRDKYFWWSLNVWFVSIRIAAVLFILILSICLIACERSYKSKNPNQKSTENNGETGIFKRNTNNFKLGTIDILTNKNLSSLISNLEKSTLKESNNVADIPVFIRETLNNLTIDSFSIANPEEKWQITDVIIDDKLPNRQLIYLGVGENICLMAYYTGGIGVSEHILIIRYEGQKITDFWCGNILEKLKSKNKIIEYLKNRHSELNTNIFSIGG